MFTGLVREVGEVVSFENGRLVVACSTAAEPGDSVAIAGVCLTVVDNGGGRLAFDVVPETIARVKPFGELVNVEAAPALLRYCVDKGSVTLDGVSLTVAAVDDTGFEVALVPHTLAVTTLS